MPLGCCGPAECETYVVGLPGPPGPPGTPGSDGDGTIVYNESPGGVRNGVNVTFTLVNTPQPGSTGVYRNGLREQLGVGYTESGSTLVFSSPPLADDILSVDYLIGS